MKKQTTTPGPGLAAFLELSAVYLGLNPAVPKAGGSRDARWPSPRRLTSPSALGYPARERYLRCERQRRPESLPM